MLDTREANILRHALSVAGTGGTALSERAAADGLDIASLTREERDEASRALDGYAARNGNFGALAADLSKRMRTGR